MKAQRVMDGAEDIGEVLAASLAQQEELLRQVRRGAIEVTTSKQQLVRQSERLGRRAAQLEEQARRAIALDREDLARLALERKQTCLVEAESVRAQLVEVEQEERRLCAAEQQLSARIEEFRIRRETVLARYTAAEAGVRVKEALTGVSRDSVDAGLALGRAEEKTERMRARALAIDLLIDNGTLALPGGGDLIERDLRAVESANAVDRELAALRRQFGPHQEPPALASGS